MDWVHCAPPSVRRPELSVEGAGSRTGSRSLHGAFVARNGLRQPSGSRPPNRSAHNSTTERRTVPLCILSNADSRDVARVHRAPSPAITPHPRRPTRARPTASSWANFQSVVVSLSLKVTVNQDKSVTPTTRSLLQRVGPGGRDPSCPPPPVAKLYDEDRLGHGRTSTLRASRSSIARYPSAVSSSDTVRSNTLPGSIFPSSTSGRSSSM